MPLNLISDPWIPVIDSDGTKRIMAPWQMAETATLRPDWPRADLNLACLAEFGSFGLSLSGFT